MPDGASARGRLRGRSGGCVADSPLGLGGTVVRPDLEPRGGIALDLVAEPEGWGTWVT